MVAPANRRTYEARSTFGAIAPVESRHFHIKYQFYSHFAFPSRVNLLAAKNPSVPKRFFINIVVSLTNSCEGQTVAMVRCECCEAN